MPSVVALIPARSGSKRIANKNVRELAGRPLIAYTIAAARESGVFDQIIVSSDDAEYRHIAAQYRADTIARPEAYASDNSPDFQWISHVFTHAVSDGSFDAFCILRPTSPFRSADTIRRAWASFLEDGADSFDSLRSITKPKNHPNKMWIRQGHYITPYAPFVVGNPPQPGHSVPTQLLPDVLAQPATIEIAWTKTLTKHKNISGTRIKGFYLDMPESHDLNDEYDWLLAEAMIANGIATLPAVPEIQRPARRPRKEAAHA